MRTTTTDSKKPGILVFTEPVQRMTLGISASEKTFFPSVSLLYRDEVTPAVVAIANSMRRQRRKPHVYIWNSTVVVIFHVAPASKALLEKVFPDAPGGVLNAFGRDPLLFAPTEACDFEAEWVDKFIRLFGHLRYFILSIQRGKDDTCPLWYGRVTSFKTGPVDPEELLQDGT